MPARSRGSVFSGPSSIAFPCCIDVLEPGANVCMQFDRVSIALIAGPTGIELNFYFGSDFPPKFPLTGPKCHGVFSCTVTQRRTLWRVEEPLLQQTGGQLVYRISVENKYCLQRLIKSLHQPVGLRVVDAGSNRRDVQHFVQLFQCP